VSEEWLSPFCRQNRRKCSQSPVSTGITAERFYPDFENKILATGEGLGKIVVLFLVGWS